MSEINVSVIMPVFNASNFIHRSLQSVLSQTLRNIEIICVNDGSTDDSLEILKQYSEKDKRVKVIDKNNEGYGKALNIGIDIASGEYIGILEPDDAANIHMFEDLYAIALDNDADVVKSNYYECEEKTHNLKMYESLKRLPYNKVITAEDNMNIFYVRPSVWSAIYRRNFLISNSLRFDETPGASYQDTGFAFKVWCCAQRIVLTRNAYIYYTVDNTASSVKSSGKVYSVCDEMHSIESFLNQNSSFRNKYSKVLQSVKLDTYYWNLNRISEDYKKQFIATMGSEFLKSQYDGFLDKTVLGETRWNILEPILNEFIESPSKEEYEQVINSKAYKLGLGLLFIPKKMLEILRSR